MTRVAIITTHPIQYYAPIFWKLSANRKIMINVFYTWPQSQQGKFDPGFGKAIEWDVPLLEGYRYTFVKNTAKKPTSSSFWGIQNPTLIREIEQWGADAILIFSWSYRSNLAVLRHFKGKIPIFFRGDSHLLDEVPGVKTLLRRTILSLVYKYVDFAFYVGENNRQYFVKHGIRPSQLLLAPHVVDNERFSKYGEQFEIEAQQWRSQLAIPDDALVYLFAAKLGPKKDPHLLLRAFTELNDPATYLVMVGNGPLEEELKNAYGSHPRVRFLDFQNQSRMPVIYRLGDVFVLPSKGPAETWGLAVNEAMACGRPVIVSSKVGGAVDLVQPGRNGFIFEAGNEQSLLNVFRAVDMEGPVRLKEMGNESAEIIKNWSLQRLTECLEQGILSRLASVSAVEDR